MRQDDLDSALRTILDAAITATHADFGNIQLLNAETSVLEIVAHRGFGPEFLEFFSAVHENEAACGTAKATGQRVVVEEVTKDPIFANPILQRVIIQAQVPAVQSTPLFGRSGDFLGMISTHFRTAHRPEESELRIVDLFARQAADFIEHHRLRAQERKAEAARQAAESASLKSHEQLRVITDAMSAPVTRCSRDMHYLWVSKPYADWLGRSVDEIIGKRIVEVIGPEALTAINPFIHRVLAGERVEYEERIFFRGPGLRWIHAVYTPTLDKTGVPDGWVAVVLDIDDRRRAEEALLESDRRKNEFLAMLGHELRNPISAISHAAAILEQTGNHSQPTERALAIIRRQVNHVGRMMDELLDLGRLTSGRIKLTRVPQDLAEAVSRTLATLAASGVSRDHRVETDLRSVWINADTVRIEQIINNLIVNALKFTPKGGRIRITVERQAQRALLTVKDSGSGIKPDLLPRIFDLFERGETAFDKDPGGLGIGLAVVKRLVEMRQGSVNAVSESSNTGSTFSVSLPTIDPPQLEAPQNIKSAPNGLSRILIVEDNDDNRDTLMELLTSAGHAVCAACDGEESLSLAREFWPQLVIIDIGLPVWDGYEVARRLRQQLGKSVRLVAMSGFSPSSGAAKMKDFDAYFIKPIDPAKLLQMAQNASHTNRGGSGDDT
jgi:PAS domain S-box-containing protein